MEYVGVTYDLFWGDKTGKNFQQVLGVHGLEFDNDIEEVERKFIDGTSLKISKNFTATIKFTITDIGQTNLNKIVPGHLYASGESVDGVDGVTVGAKGAVQVGVKKSTSAQVPGILKIAPRLASQAGRTRYMLGAESTITDTTLEDGLTEYEISITGRLVDGDLTFA